MNLFDSLPLMNYVLQVRINSSLTSCDYHWVMLKTSQVVTVIKRQDPASSSSQESRAVEWAEASLTSSLTLQL